MRRRGDRQSLGRFCFSDGSILVCGGKSSYLQIWNLETHKLIKIIELPKVIKEIKDMAFLSESFDGGSHKVSRPRSITLLYPHPIFYL